ncbi:thioredoxin domain-containing protein [Costertonia aggregata]|uniref:Thioredoxin domain-containing protein n=1 Tax=Costertonia aggregata TaxID=343403 RepID=A0A7H9AML6_9FLAO|nr:thioredoxin domain-containing protein [Costertonia aggregata]QLG44525.1 thioredoxin domain-containing protein [Costertonia aggregata]
MPHKHTNNLINETSPYLLQHAHNPVQWEAWSEDLLKKAQQENKLLLISIGYAACHWCHVMEHECFEDEEVARTMNADFINIKIDREERPDIDHIYMDALQMMTGSGGWPLNVVALPDGRPFWGATYVKKNDWIKVLKQLSDLHKKDPEKVTGYAKNMAEGIQQINLVEHKTDTELYTLPKLDDAVQDWSNYFDTFLGGYKRAPKFMMPVNLDFLLHYSTSQNNENILEYVNTTLTRMAYGGIFDHVGGGFSRYAVDTKWHVPHFEKMLYDNGQLVSLYAQAYAATKNELYKKVIEKTVQFVTDELMDENHAFYSSLDADSLNEHGTLEEGAYYVWKKEVLKNILCKDYKIFEEYYNINPYGHWENDNFVLIRDKTNAAIAKKYSITVEQLNATLETCLALLSKERDKRSRPRLDDKILTSWNGLMLKGLVDAYRYLQNNEYLQLAQQNGNFIMNTMMKKDGSLFHNHKNGKSTINGYLEDYASVIDAFIGLYEVTFDTKWLNSAKNLTNYCIAHFYDNGSGLFFFTSKKDPFVIRRTLEVADNVIPASNSIMAKNLFKLSKLFSDESYAEKVNIMLKNVQDNFGKNAQSHANWLHLILYKNQPYYEVAIVGKEYIYKAKEIHQAYLPNTVLAATEKDGELALVQHRHIEHSTQIYICEEGVCKLPLTQTKKALALLNKTMVR